MTLYTQAEVRAEGRRVASLQASAADGILKKSAASATGEFDVFLSHSFRDAEVILGVKSLLEARGQSVYVDWVEDPQLDRSRVTASTAGALRERMRKCRSLIYATSDAAAHSKWMPWELGYFDGLRGQRIAIMPLMASSSSTFVGQEYLGLYPLVEKLQESSTKQLRPYVTRTIAGGQRQFKTLSGLAAGNVFKPLG